MSPQQISEPDPRGDARDRLPYRELNAAEVKQRLPIVTLESFDPPRRPEDAAFGTSNGEMLPGAVFFPTGGYVTDPQLAAHNLQVAAESAGAVFRFNTTVVEIPRRAGRVDGVVLADGEHVSAPVVVNVAGPHSFKINQMADVERGMKIKTKALRHEVAHVPSPPGFDYEHDGIHFSDQDTATYCRPEVGNHILIGSEDPECDKKEWVDPDDFSRELTEQGRIQAMRVAQRFTGLPIPSRVRGVVELYDVSDDWIPIYDKSDLPGFYMAVGTSGNQFKNAPVVGEMMAALINACEAGQDHDADPVGFHLRHIDRTVSMGFYSGGGRSIPAAASSVLGGSLIRKPSAWTIPSAYRAAGSGRRERKNEQRERPDMAVKTAEGSRTAGRRQYTPLQRRPVPALTPSRRICR
jgi:sarcosine oxidase subunit beta